MKTIAQQLPITHRRRALADVAWVDAIAAIGGADGLATGTLELGTKLNPRLPFASPVLDGDATIAGASLIGWITVQLAFLRAPSAQHAMYAAVGVAFFLYGRHQSNRDHKKEH